MSDSIPKNNENTLYINCGSYWTHDFSLIMDYFYNHFGESSKFEDFLIGSEHIHTRCIGYDRYDPSDYDNYIIITRKL